MLNGCDKRPGSRYRYLSMDELRLVVGVSLDREAVQFRSPGSPLGTTAEQWSAAHPGIPISIHPIRRRRFTNVHGERIVFVAGCQPSAAYRYPLLPVSLGGVAAPLAGLRNVTASR
jgi:hypothetical protein